MQDPNRWGLARFPRRFLRLLRRFEKEMVTLSGAAAMTHMPQEELEAFLTGRPAQADEVSSGQTEEFEFLSESS